MSVTARTWVEGEIATAAKFNTIRDDLLELDAVAGIRSIQYGSISLNGVTSNTATITAVAAGKAVLIHLGVSQTGGVNAADIAVRITLTSTTVVTATRETTVGNPTVNFCVLEYN